jgi:hypothetical protein
MHSQAVRGTPLHAWAIVDNNGSILAAHCNCMAGLGETCSHIAAVLFNVEVQVRMREAKTPTQVKAYWLIPTQSDETFCKPTGEIDFTSPQTRKRKLDEAIMGAPPEKPAVEQRKISKPTNEELNTFYSELSKAPSKPAILSLRAPFSTKYIPKPLQNTYPKPLSELANPEFDNEKYSVVLEHCNTLSPLITENEVKLIEEDTKQQSKSKLWNRYRAGRITASRLRQACHSPPTKPSVSLIKNICYPDWYKFRSKGYRLGLYT